LNGQPFQTPIEYLKSVGTARADVLKKELAIKTFENLLQHFPFRHIDRTRFYKIKDIQQDLPYVQVIERETGIMELVWFQGIKWTEKNMIPGKAYILFGKPGSFNGKAQMPHPEFDLYSPEVLQRNGNMTLQPVYSSTEKLKAFTLDSKGIQKLIAGLLELHAKDIHENLPLYIINQFKLMARADAYRNIHFPEDAEKLVEARHRLKFEELFFLRGTYLIRLALILMSFIITSYRSS
jgi:ATP-dependent DNA helicase RecG